LVDTTTIGAYTITYTATDAAGNIATATRTVNVTAGPVDTLAPVITILGANPAAVILGGTYTDAGATALDNVDGAITPIVTGSVDATTLGSYTITYTATDAAGNIATATRTVDVILVDTTAPTITILGNNPETVTVGGTYTDAGATAVDNVDGVVTPIATGLVDTTTIGAYTITYTATDAAGNIATATRTVNVTAGPVDTLAPVITILGANPAAVILGGTYTDAGATALDNVDGAITPIVTGSVDATTLGSYTITYTATDAAGNIATATRTVDVILVDTTAPTITILGNNPETVTVGGTYTDAGATAVDNVDGVVTPIATGLVDTTTIGAYTITYTATDTATDAAGNIATATRTVNVTAGPVDTLAPVITILGANPAAVILGGTYTDAGATALDNVDGAITPIVTGSVDATTLGSYTITYTATDAAGNIATATRTVDVILVDTTAPTITILGNNPETVTVGGTYTDAGATAVDNVDGVVTPIATGLVDTTTIGAYTITYTATDAAGNIATATRTVTVTAGPVDTLAPVITILGANPAAVILGGTYTDAGATALDNVDGAITPVVVSTVDETTLGSYTITYTATDAAGNVATATRTVDVILVDTTAPVITILGNNPENVTVGGTYTDAGATAVDALDGAITPIATGLVDTTTIGSYTITYTATDAAGNIATATRTVNVTAFPADTTPPSTVTVTSSHPVNAISSNTSLVMSWSDATDNVGVAGYSFIIDSTANTIPDNGIDTSATTTTQVLAFGTYYFHVSAIDGAGNTGTPAHYGPVIISDSQVLITNSTIGGTYYALYSPSLASAATASTTGTTTIVDSTITTWWDINNSHLSGVTLDNAAVNSVNATTTTIINSDLAGCSITNSLVKNYFAIGCTVSDSIVDPPSGMNNLTGSTVGGSSQIYFSDVTFSTVWSSYIATSTVTNSTITNATTTNSTIINGVLVGATFTNSTGTASTVNNGSVVTNSMLATSTVAASTVLDSILTTSNVATSTLTNATTTASLIETSTITNSTLTTSTTTASTVVDSTITNSVLTNATSTNSTLTNVALTNSTLTNVTVLGTGTVITGTIITGATITDGNIVNGVMNSGTILGPTGTPIVVTVPTPLTDLINYVPVAGFTASANNLNITVTDSSTDQNSGGVIGDSFTYLWNFGDGTFATANTATVGNNQTHTYTTPGIYTVTLTLSDAFGGVATASQAVTVVSPVVVAPAPAPVVGGGGIFGAFFGALAKILGDVNGDGWVNSYDFAILMADWGKNGHFSTDLNGDSNINKYDLSLMMANWTKN
jgi:uncharacterized protein YjbI with pentapeptide repeats